MERRKFLIGVGSAAAGGSALVGSGAFSAAEIGPRDVAFRDVGDANALLAIEPGTDNGEYIKQVEPEAGYGGDVVELDFSDHHEDVGGKGVQQGSIYWFDNLLMLTNNGPHDVKVWVTEYGATSSRYYWGDERDSDAEEQKNARPLPSGESIQVGLEFELWGGNEFGEITIHADSMEEMPPREDNQDIA